MTLKAWLAKAQKESWALPHFNFSNLEMLKSLVQAAQEARSPVMVGTSEGERNFIGLREAVFMVESFREGFGVEIFLNADHSKSAESAKKAIDSGYDSVHIDLSNLSFGENVKGTKEVVNYRGPTSIEGELVYLPGESKIQNKKFELKPEDLTDPDEAARFVRETGVDRFAGAFGNIHGISLDEPALYIERIKAVRKALSEDIALVLHAGSGIPDGEIKAAIAAGISNIHISTELRSEFREELEKSLHKKGETEYAPYKIMGPVVEGIKEKAIEKIKLFGSVNRV